MNNSLPYSSLHDPHLQTYFQNKNIQKHLRKIGLINRHGEIVSYKEYELKMNERSRQEHVRALLSHGIVQRVIELEKSRQANIRNQYEATTKRTLVENTKESKQQYRQLRSSDFTVFNRPKTSHSNNVYQQQKQNKKHDENKQISSNVSSINPPHSLTKPILSTRYKSPKINKSNINIKNYCQITMIYYGPQTNLNYQINSYEIIVMQQHCGGENIIIYKNNLQPNEKFTFESRRHNQYPFALSLYVNGFIDSRISVCCEYKHKNGVPLGGKRASFAILNVQGGQPCQICRFNEYLSNYPLFKEKTSDKSSLCTDTSKTRISDYSNTHQLLRTPSPYDEHESDTIASNQNDEYREAQEMYEKFHNKIDNNNCNWEENGYIHIQLGNICKEGLCDYEKALEHYLTSLEIYCQHISPLNIKLRNLYLSIGHIILLCENNSNDLAIKYFQRVLDIDYSINNINERNLINDHNYLGLLYQNEENYSQALIHFEKSLKYYLVINSKINFNENFFENYFSNTETIYDKKAYESLSIKKLPNLSEIYFNLATTYQYLGNKQNALKYVQKALQLSKSDQTKYNIYENYLKKLQQI